MQDNSNDTNRFAEGLRSFVTFRIMRVQNKLNAQAAAMLRKHTELSLTEWRIVSLLNLTGPTTASSISRVAEMDKGQISRGIKPLIERGLVKTSEHEQDNRQTILALTDEGSKIVRENSKIMRARQQRLTHDISDAELKLLYDILDRLYDNAEMPGK